MYWMITIWLEAKYRWTGLRSRKRAAQWYCRQCGKLLTEYQHDRGDRLCTFHWAEAQLKGRS